MTTVNKQEVREIGAGFDPDPARSMSLRAAAYTDPKWSELDLRAIFGRLVLQAYEEAVQLTEPRSADRARCADRNGSC